MKHFTSLSVLIILFICDIITTSNSLPEGFIHLSNVNPTIIQEIRYYADHNFVGHKINGYAAPECILTVAAAKNLSFVQQELLLLDPPLSLKVYDCYRPQRAVDEFYSWSLDPQLTQMQLEFYPGLNKSTLFDLGYIARRSGHSRGSTIDLTIVPYPPPAQPVYKPGMPLTSCTAPYGVRFADNSLDMGTGFDCFNELAHTMNPNVHGVQLEHRLLLKRLMNKHLFNNYALEWWHYTLIDEPFPDTYFDFEITMLRLAKNLSKRLGNSKRSYSTHAKYGLYLIFEDKIADVPTKTAISQAVAGGTTMVQIREKKKSTSELIKEAREIKALLRGSSVPLIINDRIDVALACDADGVHVGQTDMEVKDARRILGPNKIIGCTVSNPYQAKLALFQGADYLGTDAIFPTATKPDSRPLGLAAFKDICDSTSLPVVAIGSVNRSNAQSCLDAGAIGLAACASILDSRANGGSITEACKELRRVVDLSRPQYSEELAHMAAEVITAVRMKHPLIVHITNTVTINDVANVTLLCGASPVMAQENTEMVELADALVLNMGTLDGTQIETMISCGRVANKRGIPVVFDPVGAGATPYRTAAAKRILDSIHVDILRGNASEIAALADLPASTRGVDSGVVQNKHAALKALASKDRIVIMTGKHDLLSDGQIVYEVHNNSAWLQTVTGTGCMLTAVLGAFATVGQYSRLEASAAALAYYAAAAERAESSKPNGPASFKQLFFDALADVGSDFKILRSNLK